MLYTVEFACDHFSASPLTSKKQFVRGDSTYLYPRDAEMIIPLLLDLVQKNLCNALHCHPQERDIYRKHMQAAIDFLFLLRGDQPWDEVFANLLDNLGEDTGYAI